MKKAIIKVESDKANNPTMILRQFSKKVIGSGLLRKARGNRYYVRAKTDLAKKKSALNRLKKKGEIETLLKMGKAIPTKGRRRR